MPRIQVRAFSKAPDPAPSFLQSPGSGCSPLISGSLYDEKIKEVIKSSKICSNITDECKPFYEGIDQMINDGLLHNTSIADEIDMITRELDGCM